MCVCGKREREREREKEERERRGERRGGLTKEREKRGKRERRGERERKGEGDMIYKTEEIDIVIKNE